MPRLDEARVLPYRAIRGKATHWPESKSGGAKSQPLRLVNPGRSLPIDKVNQLPWVPNEIDLQLPLLIDGELGCGVQDTRAFALVRVI